MALEQKIKDVVRQEDIALETKKREAQTNDTSRSMLPICNEVVFNHITSHQTLMVFYFLSAEFNKAESLPLDTSCTCADISSQTHRATVQRLNLFQRLVSCALKRFSVNRVVMEAYAN